MEALLLYDIHADLYMYWEYNLKILIDTLTKEKIEYHFYFICKN